MLISCLLKRYRIPLLMPRPRELRNNASRDVSPWSILACFRADFSCLGPEHFAHITSSDSEDTVSEALGRPLGRRLATCPEADASLLGELGVVVEVCPHREHDLRDAGAGRGDVSAEIFVVVFDEFSLLLFVVDGLTKHSRGNLPRLRASRAPRCSPSPSAQKDRQAATAAL